MQKIREFLKLEENSLNIKIFMLLMLAAYVFSIGARYYWVSVMADNPQAIWNGHLMINTNDGYQWAEGARDILQNSPNAHTFPATSSASILTAFFAKILPFDFETVILWLPAFLGSLLVLPVMLIGRALNQDILGFIAGLTAGIAWSYYNRTMAGYYDTDMLVIVFPTFILWSLILAVTHNKNRYLLFTTFFILFYKWWYGGSSSLILSFAIMTLFYILLFDRKNIFNYKILIFLLIPMMAIPTTGSVYIKVVLALLLFGLFHYRQEKADKFVLYILGAIAAYVLFSGGFNAILVQLDRYVIRHVVADENVIKLHYFNVVQTVREAGKIPFETFANRISGHPILFVLSTIGYILMSLRYRVMLLALPMVGLGFLALKGGLRFTVYTVPINALGIAFLIVWIANFAKNHVTIKYAIISVLSFFVLLPNIIHIKQYLVPVVFNKSEVEVLDTLGKKAKRDDYTIAWWDYGYPIRYYAKTKILIDGGAHNGNQNFPISYTLTFPQQEAAIMAKLAVEHKFLDKMMKAYEYKNPNSFLQDLTKLQLPKKEHDIYLYLPLRMMNIYQTITLFSWLDLTTGRSITNPFFVKSLHFKELGDKILLSDFNIIIDKRKNVIKLSSGQEIPINAIYLVGYDNRGKVQVRSHKISSNGLVSVVFMKSYGQFLIVDQNILNSTYFQLFVFEQYDKNLYEPVVLTPFAKVYKIK